jgi:hypothetical protein
MARNGFDLIGIAILFLGAAGLLLFGACLLVPDSLKSKLKRLLNGAIFVLGLISPFTLFAVWAASHDIFADYASDRLFSKAGRAIPGWYDPLVNSCPGEWKALSVAFFLILAFHLLLFLRFLLSVSTGTKDKSAA